MMMMIYKTQLSFQDDFTYSTLKSESHVLKIGLNLTQNERCKTYPFNTSG